MKYDQTSIPAGYDRGRDHGPAVLELWMNAAAKHFPEPIHAILDLGCGTGRFAEGLALRFNAMVIGLDPSRKMLEQARAKGHDARVRYQQGSAEAVPLRDRSVDAVFISMSYHHFSDPAAGARECRRVLRPGGRVLVRTGSREQIEAYPYVPFFPDSRQHLAEQLPAVADIRKAFASGGFACLAEGIIEQTIAPDWMAYADKLAAGADSILARLDAADFERGLAEIRRHAALTGSQPITEPIDVLVFG